MHSLERTFVEIVLATIWAVTIANLVVNYKGTVKIGETILGFPIGLARELRAGDNR